MYPYGRSSDMGIMGGCEDDDEWDYRNVLRRQRAETVLSQTTSLGRPAILEQEREIKKTVRSYNQDGLNQFLVQMNRFTAGDYITFSNYPVGGQMVTWSTISFIIAVDRIFEEVVWAEKEDVPKPFLLLDLSPMHINGQNIVQSARFSNCLFSRHITAAEANGTTRNNVQLQNYIEQAKAALKAGTLTIRG